MLDILDETPDISQRELAKKLKISLGAANYTLRALIEIGHVKLNNFKKNPSKSSYFYLLTRGGLTHKAILASDFLKRKVAEYEALKSEIIHIQSKINEKNYPYINEK